MTTATHNVAQESDSRTDAPDMPWGDPLPEPAKPEEASCCSRCGHKHAEVSFATWMWQLRDTYPKPPGGQLGALAVLASRLSAKTGCGRVALGRNAADAGVSVDTAGRAIAWAEQQGLLRQAERGHRITGERSTASLWMLTVPAQSSTGAELAQDTQSSTGAELADPTPQDERPNSAPVPSQPRTGAGLKGDQVKGDQGKEEVQVQGLIGGKRPPDDEPGKPLDQDGSGPSAGSGQQAPDDAPGLRPAESQDSSPPAAAPPAAPGGPGCTITPAEPAEPSFDAEFAASGRRYDPDDPDGLRELDQAAPTLAELAEMFGGSGV
jgi:hypothetical protein